MKTLSQLIHSSAWPDVAAEIAKSAPDSEALPEYEAVFRELLRLAPTDARGMRICIERVRDEDSSDTQLDVSGKNGTLNRDQPDFAHLRQPADGDYALAEACFGLALESWESWLAMPIDSEALRDFRQTEIVGLCLYEMTFFGFDQTRITAQRAELERRAAEVEAMTAEERERKLVPGDQVRTHIESRIDELRRKATRDDA